MKYTLTIEGDFEKGECKKCPIGVASDVLKGKGVIYSCMYALGGGSKEFCPLEEVKQGEWCFLESYGLVGEGIVLSLWTCSNCGNELSIRKTEVLPNTCPVCKAKMRGGKE